DGSDVAILGAGRALGNAAARALGALYENQAARRPAIMRVAAEKGLRALLERAVGAPSLEVRRLAVAGLSKLAKPPRAPLERALKDSDARVRLAAQVGLARLGASGSLLSLGAAARGSCAARELVLAVFSASLDRASRARLLADALDSHCRALGQHVWTLAVRYQRDDPTLWRAGLSHADRSVRVRAALTALGVKGPLVERAP
ncbi:MAG: hypothetical protein KC503_35785, partial [Myxococcales bacterium]|nr:hypothetical protein [Myxococcales bacterium]